MGNTVNAREEFVLTSVGVKIRVSCKQLYPLWLVKVKRDLLEY